VFLPPEPQITGALGAALIARHDTLARQSPFPTLSR